jgi:hypothetical protein
MKLRETKEKKTVQERNENNLERNGGCKLLL